MNQKKEVICISAQDKSLEAKIFSSFNVCPYFLIIRPDKDEIKAIPNPGAKDNPWAEGLPAAQAVLKENISVLLTGYLGPKSFGALEAYGIKICIGLQDISCQRALNDFLLGKFKPIN